MSNPILEFSYSYQEEEFIKKIVYDFYIVDTSHCNNTVQDADETDVDCGGVSCDSCGDDAGKCTFFLIRGFISILGIY